MSAWRGALAQSVAFPSQVRGAGAPSGMQLAEECVAANTEAMGQGVGQGS